MLRGIAVVTAMTLFLITDGLRWWGFLAALAGIPMAARVLVGVAYGNRQEVRLGPWAGLGLLCFFLFLLIAGLSIPVATRLGADAGVGGNGSPPPEVVFVFWAFAATAGWLLNVALAPGKQWLFATAGLLLPFAIAASVMTSAP